MFEILYKVCRHKLWMVLFLLMGSGWANEALASHFAGADLFYTHLGGLRYRVTVRWYRDCSGATYFDSTIHWSDGRCQPEVGNVNARSSDYPGTIQDIFCSRYNPAYKCSPATDPQNPNRPGNFIALTYTATITLPRRSRNWVFWVSANARPNVNNVTNTNDLYSDAFLNNLDFDGNNSPYFLPTNIPLPYVTKGKPFTYSFATEESDGDSLTYALSSPMMGCNGNTMTLGIYDSYTSSILADTATDPNKFAITPGGTYSPGFPIQSFRLLKRANGSGYYASRFFSFDTLNGSFTFIPIVYTPTVTTANGANKHIVVVRITERRRNNLGIWRVIGEIQRDILVTVIDSGYTPPLPPTTVPPNTNSNIKTVSDSLVVLFNAQTCTYSKATISFKDTGSQSNSKLTVSFPGFGAPGVFPIPASLGSLTILNNNTANPTGYFEMKPGAADFGKSWTINATIKDDDCPVVHRREFRFIVKVIQGNFASILKPGGIKAQKDTICLGDSSQIEATVSRPDTVANGDTVRYTYRWYKDPEIRDTLGKFQTVRPTSTKRFKFRADNDKFLGCYDTASVLIVVRTPVTPVIKTFYSAMMKGVSTNPPISIK
jgi:hypothetical protein